MILKWLFPTFVTGLLLTTSCKDYLEKPFGVAFNEDSVFARYENVQKAVYEMYSSSSPYYLGLVLNTTRLSGSMLDACTDFGSSFRSNAGYGAHKFNKGTVLAEELTNSVIGEDRFANHYTAIRRAFILLERIDEVPDASSEQKNRIKAEAQTMIAFQYFELMRRYGGVPLIKKRLDPSLDDRLVARSSLEDIYNYIIELLDKAVANPDFAARYDGQEFGRMTKAFAYGLKAKAALLVASPLFNTDHPYIELPGHNELICLNKPYDSNRWKTAYDYAESAINYCESNGYALVNTSDVYKNYTIAYQYKPSAGNTEIIWGTMGVPNTEFKYFMPRGLPMSGYSANIPSQNLVEKYRNRDDSKIDWAATSTTPLRTAPNDPTGPYKNLDPRFQQTIFCNGATYYTNVAIQNYDHETRSLNGNNGPGKASAQWAYFLRKHIYGYEDKSITQKVFQPMASYMRLAELYLASSEALNEFLSAPDSRVISRINMVRSRSGMPPLSASMTKEEMRSRIQDEWGVEFAFEEYRFWDLKRWKLGDVFKGPIYDLRVKKWNDNTYTYSRYKYEDRVFFDWYYLHPLPPTEINKQYGLIQNPGW